MANTDVFLIHGDNIVLGNGPLMSIVATGQATRVEARKVIVNGIVSTGGHDLTIVADTVSFAPGAQIDTSGQPGFGYDSNVDLNAHNGKDGVTGANGKPGAKAGNVTLYASSLTGVLKVTAVGGSGSQAQPGGNGLKGDDGEQHPQQVPWDECAFADGSNGGTGGSGGMAGRPGVSGAGGNVDVYLVAAAIPLMQPPILNLNGGPAPGDAPSGTGGPGGAAGPRPPCASAPRGVRLTAPRRRPHNGNPGATGAQLVQPVRADMGNRGSFCGQDPAKPPLQPNVLLQKDLCLQVSPQTLWNVLQAGEQAYINDHLEQASMSLSFVSMMGRR